MMELSILGLLVLVVIVINTSEGKYGQVMVAFLGLVLLSMLAMNWDVIKPLLITSVKP